MANQNYLERNQNGSSQTTPRRGTSEWLALEPLNLFRNFYSPLSLGSSLGESSLDISRTENGYVVEIPVAGFKPDHIEITYKDDVLSVSGKNERRTFTRSLMLPEEIDPDQVQAKVEHGLLTLTLNRRPEAEPKRIPITVN